MPDSTVVPQGWSVELLSKCVDVLDSRRKPVNSKERDTRPGSIPYYGATGQVGWIDDFLFDEELVLIGEDGAPFFDKSKPIAYIIDGKAWVNNHAHVLRALTSVTSNRYMKHYLDAFDFTGYVQGSTRDKLTQGAMRSIPILLAPRDLQDALVELIDEVVKRRASASNHVTAARRSLDRFRQAVLAAACLGRLTNGWREAHPDVPSVEHGLLEFARSQKPRRQSERAIDLPLSGLPDNYVVSSVGACADVLEYGTSKRCDAESDQGIPVLRMGNIQDGRLSFADLKYCEVDREIERLMLEDGDLLFNRTNSPELVGKSAVFHGTEPTSFASYLIRVRFEDHLAVPDFVNYWLNSAWGRHWARLAKTDGVSQSNINGTKLALMPMPLPPIDEQKVIVERASRMLNAADAVLARIRHVEQRVDHSSQAVLAKAFRGGLVPPEGVAR